MGISIRVATANFANKLASLTLPSVDNLVGEWLINTDTAHAVINRANPSLPMTQVGTPTYAPGFTNISGGGYGQNGFDTHITPTGDITMFAICRPAGIGELFPFTFYSPSNNVTGFSVLTSGSGAGLRFFNNRYSSGADIARLDVPNTGGFFFTAGVGPLGLPPKIYLGTSGVLSSNTGLAAGTAPRDVQRSLRIGLDQTGDGAIAYAAIYEGRSLTEAEVLAAYLSLKSFFGTLISIL